ncbi:MAG: hypothetical protein ABSE93_23010 [Terriglobia bacterium]
MVFVVGRKRVALTQQQDQLAQLRHIFASPLGSGVICEERALQAAVIPVPLCGRNPLRKPSETRCPQIGFLPQSGTGMTGVS